MADWRCYRLRHVAEESYRAVHILQLHAFTERQDLTSAPQPCTAAAALAASTCARLRHRAQKTCRDRTRSRTSRKAGSTSRSEIPSRPSPASESSEILTNSPANCAAPRMARPRLLLLLSSAEPLGCLATVLSGEDWLGDSAYDVSEADLESLDCRPPSSPRNKQTVNALCSGR